MTDSYLDSNCLSCEKKLDPISLVLVGLMVGRQAGRLADEIQLDCKILKVLYKLNYFDFYFVYSNAMLLIVLEVNFSLLFFSVAIFMSISTIRY